MSDFEKGIEEYKQKTDLFPHPSIAEGFRKRGLLMEGGTRQPTPEERERNEKISQAVNQYIAQSKKIAEATKRSRLVFKDSVKLKD